MSTSADPAGFQLAIARYTDDAVQRLVAEVQAEYVVRYGGPDATPVDPTQFDQPQGIFLLGRAQGQPVACGGWRSLPTSLGVIAEIKRMYVAERWRRRGLAARTLLELEHTAMNAGFGQIWLETGSQQPEAIALYARMGYQSIAAFGHYRDAPGAIHLGKALRPGTGNGAADS